MRFAIALIVMLTTGLPAAIARADDASEIDAYISQVPTARLVAESGEQQSRIGTFCWTRRKYLITSEGVCVDASGLVTSSEPLDPEPSETIQIDLPKGLGRADVKVCWIHHPTEQLDGVGDSRLIWTQPLTDCQIITGIKQLTVTSPKQPGLHAMSMFAVFINRRDAVHGFLLLVENQD